LRRRRLVAVVEDVEVVCGGVRQRRAQRDTLRQLVPDEFDVGPERRAAGVGRTHAQRERHQHVHDDVRGDQAI